MKIIAIDQFENVEDFGKIAKINLNPNYDLIVRMTQEEYNEMIHALFKYREELLTKEKGD